MLVKGLRVGIVAWIPIIFCVLGCVSTKDDQLAIARHFFRRSFSIPSVNSGGSNGLARDEVVKEKNKWSDFILDTHPKERVDGGLSSPGGIRTAEVAGGIAEGSSGKSTHGSDSITKSTLLKVLTPRRCDFDGSKNCNENERTAEESSIDGVDESEPFLNESEGRQKRGTNVNRRVTDDKIFFPESSSETRLNAKRKNQPNNSATAVVGGNQPGNADGEGGGEGVDTYFLSKTPINCPSGHQLLKGRCRAVRE